MRPRRNNVSRTPQPIGNNNSPSTREAYQQLVLELLQLQINSKSDSSVIYPFLAQHQDKLNPTFQQVFLEVGRLLLSQPKIADDMAGVIENTCIHIMAFPLGSRYSKGKTTRFLS